MKKALTKEAFFAADDLPLQWHELPEELYGKGAGVYIRHMSGKERSMLEERYSAADGELPVTEFRPAVIMLATANENGELLFAAEDELEVMKKNAGVLEGIFEHACRLNGLSRDDVEELEGNSESSQPS